MDILFLHGLQAQTRLGVFDWEQIHLQPILLDLELMLPPHKNDDNIKNTVNYAQLTDDLRAYLKNISCQLIETLAEEIAIFILKNFAVESVKITLKKQGILNQVQSVGIMICRDQKILKS